MSIADLLAQATPEARYYDYDRKIMEDYDNRVNIYNDALNQYQSDYDVYKGKIDAHNELANAFNTRLQDYQTSADAYNAAIKKFNEGDRLTAYKDTDYYVASPGEFSESAPIFKGGDEPTAPTDPGFEQKDIDAFIDEATGRATRRGQTAATAFNVLSQGGNFATAPQVQGGAGVGTVPEFSFSGTGFADGGGVGEFFQRFNPLTGSYRKETPLSVKAMEQAQDFTPIGTAETVREIYKESQEEDPNKAKMGIMALAELASYAPAVGPGAKQAVRMMMGGNKKLPDDVIQKMKEQQIRVMEEELKDGVVIMRDRGEPERKIEAFVKKKRGDIFEARGLPRDMDDFYADGGVVSFAPYLR